MIIIKNCWTNNRWKIKDAPNTHFKRWRGYKLEMREKQRRNEEKMEKDMEKSKEMARLAISALEDKKAEDIKVIDISEVSVIADYFIIGGGSNHSQIQALCDNVEEKLGRAGFALRQKEGYAAADWILMDFGDLIVHIFDRENRLLYDLERIWRDGKQIPSEEL